MPRRKVTLPLTNAYVNLGGCRYYTRECPGVLEMGILGGVQLTRRATMTAAMTVNKQITSPPTTSWIIGPVYAVPSTLLSPRCLPAFVQ